MLSPFRNRFTRRLGLETLEARLALSSTSLLPQAPLGTTAMVLQPDDKVVTVGAVQAPTGEVEFEVTRQGADGSLDASFGSGGQQLVSFHDLTGLDDARASAVTLDRQGDIVVGGTASDDQGHSLFAIARLTAAGKLDSRFGHAGHAGLDDVNFASSTGLADDRAQSVEVDDRGGIVLAGTATDDNGHGDYVVTRLDSSGKLDDRFGNGGHQHRGGRQAVSFAGLTGQADDRCAGASLDSHGNLVIAGEASDDKGHQGLGVSRLDSSGELDDQFGKGGEQEQEQGDDGSHGHHHDG